MFETCGTVFDSLDMARGHAHQIANLTRKAVYIWESDSQLPCGLVTPEILIGNESEAA
jgi:hypothetical protein